MAGVLHISNQGYIEDLTAVHSGSAKLEEEWRGDS